jgi:CheY-like chemotaxis protein
MPTSPAPRTRARLRLLVVDDNADRAFALADVLRLAGHEVHTAGNGSEALEVVAQQVRPEVVLLDLGLPGVNGCELARQLQKQDATPILIAVTGQGQEEVRRQGREAGISLHLLKPIDVGDLLGVLDCCTLVVGG